jgi:hypothetical protein
MGSFSWPLTLAAMGNWFDVLVVVVCGVIAAMFLPQRLASGRDSDSGR